LQLIVSLFILLCVTFRDRPRAAGRSGRSDRRRARRSGAAYAAMRSKLGLDLPLYQQFFIYLTAWCMAISATPILTGNPVSADMKQAFPATLELATLAVIISTFLGVPLGLIAALFRDTFIDKFARVIALVGHSIPVFWFGIVGLVIFYAG
jgi:peptide/nickel transport system permease protein